MEKAKCIAPIGYLTRDKVYQIVGKPDKESKWFTVIDDEGKCATYSAARFEVILAPQVAPNFQEMQHIADEVKITQQLHGEQAIDVLRNKFGIEPICPVVEAYEERKETHGPFMVANPDIKTDDDFATKPAMIIKHLKKCKNHAECGQPAEAERYEFCYDCWWAQDPRNKTIMQEYKENPALDVFLFEVDPNLGPDEWHLVFNDYRDLKQGVAQKHRWNGGSNMTSTFIVGRKDRYEAQIKKLEEELAEARHQLAVIRGDAE